MQLVEVTEAGHGVLLDLKYATADNFTGLPVYGVARCFIHAEAEAKLRQAIDLAAGIGLKLRLFDAFRPAEAQWVLWNHTPDPDFLADSRGAAVDLTLCAPSGVDLDMGTPFDFFSPASHHGNPTVSAAARRNRLLLMGLMTDAGWDFFRNEWWHYQLFDARRLPVLDDRVAPVRMMP